MPTRKLSNSNPNDSKLFLTDFVHVKQPDCYVHVPTGKVYTRREIDRLFPPVPVLAASDDGQGAGTAS
jgi:hypothetical protein